MKYDLKVKQIAEVKRSTKKGNSHVAQVTLKSELGDTLSLIMEPENCDFTLDEEITIEVKRPQQKFS